MSQKLVTGMTYFNDYITDEDSKERKLVSSGKLLTQLNFDESRNTDTAWKKGASQVEWKVGTEIVSRLKHLTCPFIADFQVDEVSDGKGGLRMAVRDVRPVGNVSAAGEIKPGAGRAA